MSRQQIRLIGIAPRAGAAVPKARAQVALGR